MKLKKTLVKKDKIKFNGDKLNYSIKLDWDTKAYTKIQKELWKIHQFNEFLNLEKTKVYETNKGFHLYLTPRKPMTNEQLLLIEICLGTDEFKAIIDLKRLLNNIKEWNVLFEVKFKKDKVTCETFSGRANIIERMIKNNEIYFSEYKLNLWKRRK